MSREIDRNSPKIVTTATIAHAIDTGLAFLPLKPALLEKEPSRIVRSYCDGITRQRKERDIKRGRPDGRQSGSWRGSHPRCSLALLLLSPVCAKPIRSRPLDVRGARLRAPQRTDPSPPGYPHLPAGPVELSRRRNFGCLA